MKIVRSIGKFVGFLIFSTFLASILITYALSNLVEIDTLKSVAAPIVAKSLTYNIDKEELDRSLEIIKEYCDNHENFSIPMGESEVQINCDKVKNASKNDCVNIIASEIAERQIENIYYKEYDCEVFDCLSSLDSNKITVLFSEKGKTFLEKIIMYSILGTAFGLIIILISSKTWSSRMNITGWGMISAALPIIILNYGSSAIIDYIRLPESVAAEIKIIISDILQKVFSSVFIYSVILLAFGIALVVFSFFYSKKESKT